MLAEGAGDGAHHNRRKSRCNKIYYDSIYNWLMMTSMSGACGFWSEDDELMAKRKLLFCSTRTNRWWIFSVDGEGEDAEIKMWKLHVWRIMHHHAVEGSAGRSFWRSKQVAINEPVSQPVNVGKMQILLQTGRKALNTKSPSFEECKLAAISQRKDDCYEFKHIQFVTSPGILREKLEPFSNHQIDVHFTFSRKLHQQPAKRIGLESHHSSKALSWAGRREHNLSISNIYKI